MEGTANLPAALPISCLAREMMSSSLIHGCCSASAADMRSSGFRVSNLRIRSMAGSERGREGEREK